MFQPDYIMRQIETLTQAAAKLFMHKDINKIEMFKEDGSLSGAGLLYHRLKALINQGKINEAEDLLFAELDSAPVSEILAVVIHFYRDLAALTDEQLKQANFSRAEIAQGLADVQNRLNALSEQP